MRKPKIYFYYWILSVFFLLLAIYWKNSSDTIIDINVHDTYYVIHNSHASILLAIIYAFLGSIYWIPKVLKISLNEILTISHSTIILGIVPIYFIGSSILENKKHSKFPLLDDTTSLYGFLALLWLVFILAQILLIFNLIISFIKHYYRSR